MTDKILKSYSKQEVEKSTLHYFKDDLLATQVWMKKYCLKDEKNYYELNPDDMHHRIAKEIARIETKYKNSISEEEVYNSIKNFERIIPQGSPMAGIGNALQVVSLSNCFVVGNNGESDSYGGIIKIDQEIAQLEKRRGGVGHDLSHIRPSGSPVKNSAITSTGVVPFMERYSNTTKEVAQDGRRGALMLSISIKHPDSEKFIDAKFEQGKVTGANVSVKVTDDFMEAVVQGTTFQQQFPITGNNPKVVKTVDALKIWNKIIHNAWRSAEPGVLFWDAVLRESIPDCYADLGFKTTSTNPCVSEDTLILTNRGYVEIGKVVGTEIRVWNGVEFSKVTPMITGTNQKMLLIKFSDGSELKCTPYHGFYTWEGFERDGNVVKKEAKNLVIGDKLEKYEFPNLKRFFGDSFNIETFEKNNYYTLGFFAGDGHVKRDSEYHIQLYGEKKSLLNILNRIGNVSESIDCDRISVRVGLPESISSLDINPKKYVPSFDDKLNLSLNGTLDWLAGLIDSDGSRNSEEGSVSISSIDRDFLMRIKLHVLNTFGVNGSVIDEKEGGLREIKGQEFECNKSYRLIISAHNVKKLYDLGLRTYRVKIDDVNPNRDASRFIKVVSIEEIEDAEKVYCFTEEKRGRGCFNGIVTSNCGEIPLCNDDSCRLLALNLFSYVKFPFTKDAYFDWNMFKYDVNLAMRYMDDIVDLEIEKIDAILAKIYSDPEEEFLKLYEIKLWERIKDKTIRGRRTGLGVTAEGDMIAALGLRYGTEEATEFSVEVHKTLKLKAYRTSVEMAKERGAFLIYDAEREKNNPFILRIKSEDSVLYERMVKQGRRNIALLTIAPTGTASLMTQTTSGIECCFLVKYKRRRKINPQEKNVRIDFVDDEGIAWQEYPVFHHKFEMWLQANGYDVEVVKSMDDIQFNEIVKKSPYYKATSADVDWVKKVEMQGRIQREVDHSISVSINLPNDISEEMVAKVYETGWKSGCKGMTVYRDGSRTGVLIRDDKKKETEKEETEFHENHAPKRPKRLKAEIHRFQNNLEKWIAVVGLKDDRPYELFTGKLVNGLSNIPPNIKDCEVVKNIIEVEEPDENGVLIKVKKKRYDIEYIDNEGIKRIHTGLSHAFNPEFWNYAKLISGILRHGMPLIKVYELIDSLTFREESINTWKNGVIRVIKKYIKDGEKTKGTCPECGSDHMEFKEGCVTCMNCGWSRCS
jgi:ribonucleoside-diphosphate reductase alpha chain